MTSLKILDTGYVGVEEARGSQTQLSAANRAGYDGSSSVSAFTLKIQNMSISRSTNTDAKPIPGTYTDSQTTLVSNTNRVVAVNFILYKEIVTASYNQNNVVELMRLEETAGLKILYPSATTDPDGFKTIVQALGAVNTGDTDKFAAASPTENNGTVSTTTPYLIGRVKGMTLNDNETGDYWRGSFNFEVSG